MDLVSNILILVLGAILGGGAMWIYFNRQGDSRQAQNKLELCEQQNAQLRQDWQDHLADYRSIATNLAELSGHIERQVNDAETLLLPKDTSNSIPFFSSEATEILKSVNRKKRAKVTLDNQPLDYSEQASGVFKGQADKSKETH